MSHQSDLIAEDIEQYLALHERKEMLRLLTCGSVDDGKSTLIGRLLHDSKMIYEDQLAAVTADSARHGTTGEKVDLALLMDGLKAEREQGITIDVAYRYFSTAKRKFIIADTPGHEQYTRNMATGASTCDLAVILIDARRGVLSQTKRHSFIVSLLGIKHVVVAVNKMDLVEYSQATFERIKDEYAAFAARLDLNDLHFIPISALDGDNVVESSPNMPWHQGGPLMNYLETVHIASDRNLVDLRFPVQYVLRPHLNFRGYCGTLASGVLRKGDEIVVLPSRKTSRIKSIVTFDGELDEAFAPMSITATLEDEIDVSRGDMIVPPRNLPRMDDTFEAMIVWMAEEPMLPGAPYLFKQTTKTTGGAISAMRYRVDVNTLHRSEAPSLALNEIGRCQISLNQPIAFDPYKRNRGVGSFIVVDRMTNVTVGAGMILEHTSDTSADLWGSQPRSGQIEPRPSAISPEMRQDRFAQKPATILLTGLTGSGKSTIAYALERRLFDLGRAVCVLDGKTMRGGLSKDLGFGVDDRSENLRRTAETARLMNAAGLIAICSLVAPVDDAREKARQLVGEDRFFEVFVDAPIEICRERDASGMYAQADTGEIERFPGVSAPYEPPANPDLVVKADKLSTDQCVEQIVALLKQRGVFA